MARKLIENIVPTVSLEAAIALVARYNERHDAYDRLGRQEVPMEIGSLQPKGKAPEQVDLESLNKTVQRLNTKLGKLDASLRMPVAHEVSRDTYQQHSTHEGPHKADAYYGCKQQVNVPTNQSRGLCYNCNKPRHFARDFHRPRVDGNGSPYDGNHQRQSNKSQQRVEMFEQQGNGLPL